MVERPEMQGRLTAAPQVMEVLWDRPEGVGHKQGRTSFRSIAQREDLSAMRLAGCRAG